jgi:hypothetical protein
MKNSIAGKSTLQRSAPVALVLPLVFCFQSARAQPAGTVRQTAATEVEALRRDQLLRGALAGQDSPERVRFRSLVSGIVRYPDGRPAAGAELISSTGVQLRANSQGAFEFQAEYDAEALAFDLSARLADGGGRWSARQRVATRSAGSPAERLSVDLVLATASACEPDWVPTVAGQPGVFKFGFPNPEISALTVFDDGSGAGPRLIVAGVFTMAGGIYANNIAAWDGQGWQALGAGLLGSGNSPTVESLAVFDDGGGPALYAGGSFSNAGGLTARRIAKWDGQAWSSLGAGLNNTVFSLVVHDDGSGPGAQLIAAGTFTQAGGQPANFIAKWNGQAWSTLGQGLNASVGALAVYDDGSGAGPALIVGGGFTAAGGVPANRVARWQGQTWSALGAGVNDYVNDLEVFDDGSGVGSALYVAGLFTSAGGAPASRIARWDGLAWSPLGNGFNDRVLDLNVHDDGSGPALYAAGDFVKSGTLTLARVAKWNGQTWSALGQAAGQSIPGVNSTAKVLMSHDDGSGFGPALFVGGTMVQAGNKAVGRIARWDGQDWSHLAPGGFGPLLGGGSPSVESLTSAVVGGSGPPKLYIGGSYAVTGPLSGESLASWDGQTLTPLLPINDLVVANTGSFKTLIQHDDGSSFGPALYAGGSFAGSTASYCARWNGQVWSSLAGSFNLPVFTSTVHDDGSGQGPDLYVGGMLTVAGGGVPAVGVARWDGQAWSPVGLGVFGPVYALKSFAASPGSIPDLYAGGLTVFAGGVTVSYITKWDGQNWSDVGGGVNGTVYSIEVYDDHSGSGPALYVGGNFSMAGGIPAAGIAKWDGQSWSALGAGIPDTVIDLEVFNDGSGPYPQLYAVGFFSVAGGVASQGIAKWNGQTWSPLGVGLPAGANVMEVHDDGSGPALFVGGNFLVSPAGDSYLAKYQGCPASTFTGLDGCLGNPAGLSSSSSGLVLGATAQFVLQAASGADGLGQLYAGLVGTNSGGCGLFLPGLGELLLGLAPGPVLMAAGPTTGGQVQFNLTVPNQPQWVGLEFAFQGVHVALSLPGFPIELSKALAAVVAL